VHIFAIANWAAVAAIGKIHFLRNNFY
jgi:hypothetical protein